MKKIFVGLSTAFITAVFWLGLMSLSSVLPEHGERPQNLVDLLIVVMSIAVALVVYNGLTKPLGEVCRPTDV